MKFVDEARITVRSGDGGSGCVSFRRERFQPRGGPDGGDGGKGGDVILVASSQIHTLLDFQYQNHFKAEKGAHGRGKNQHGKDAPDRIIRVPVGTLVYDDDTGELLKDFLREGERWTPVKGGKGGRGNARFATSTRQAPRKATPGQKGEERRLRLELKLLADAGLIGFPNAGKSTLLSKITAARPKIADYPFTTVEPHLGVVENREGERFILADIPGLIEGAHAGVGLGIRFLKHIERTKLLVHLIDLSPHPDRDPLEDFHVIQKELTEYRPTLSRKPQVIALNKVDLPEARQRAMSVRSYFEANGYPVFVISAATGEGLEAMVGYLFEALALRREADSTPSGS